VHKAVSNTSYVIVKISQRSILKLNATMPRMQQSILGIE